MNILDTYKEKNKNQKWFDDHFSLAEGAYGRMFEYTDTNFRTQLTFIKSALSFAKIENKPRNTWPRNTKTGQELHKHYVVPMTQAKLFKKDTLGLYSRTMKGVLYSELTKLNFSPEEEWFINYIFLLNGYFANRKNYIMERVEEDLLNGFLSVEEINDNILIDKAKELLELPSPNMTNILRSDFFYLHSFYDDPEFLTLYLRSNQEEKEELASYIENNLKSKKYICCISKKYQPSGNFNRQSLFDETRVFLLTFLFIREQNINISNVYTKLFDIYVKNITKINKKVINYLFKNSNIFNQIFLDLLEEEEPGTSLNRTFIDKIKLELIDNADAPEDYIDETSEDGRQKIKTIFAIRKKQAHLINSYKCSLEKMNDCRYFTAKSSGNNYLELHHLIPQEFRNDFSYSIEVLANYVTLCPRCHKQIHLAVDRERKHLINSLYNERISRLNLVGLSLELKDIYKYYSIDD